MNVDPSWRFHACRHVVVMGHPVCVHWCERLLVDPNPSWSCLPLLRSPSPPLNPPPSPSPPLRSPPLPSPPIQGVSKYPRSAEMWERRGLAFLAADRKDEVREQPGGREIASGIMSLPLGVVCFAHVCTPVCGMHPLCANSMPSFKCHTRAPTFLLLPAAAILFLCGACTACRVACSPSLPPLDAGIR